MHHVYQSQTCSYRLEYEQISMQKRRYCSLARNDDLNIIIIFFFLACSFHVLLTPPAQGYAPRRHLYSRSLGNYSPLLLSRFFSLSYAG